MNEDVLTGYLNVEGVGDLRIDQDSVFINPTPEKLKSADDVWTRGWTVWNIAQLGQNPTR